jgi:hypothetical protein
VEICCSWYEFGVYFVLGADLVWKLIVWCENQLFGVKIELIYCVICELTHCFTEASWFCFWMLPLVLVQSTVRVLE